MTDSQRQTLLDERTMERTLARMARELFDTHWIKLEVIGDAHTLQPDMFETVEAARTLARDGFEVFPQLRHQRTRHEHLADRHGEHRNPRQQLLRRGSQLRRRR